MSRFFERQEDHVELRIPLEVWGELERRKAKEDFRGPTWLYVLNCLSLLGRGEIGQAPQPTGQIRRELMLENDELSELSPEPPKGKRGPRRPGEDS